MHSLNPFNFSTFQLHFGGLAQLARAPALQAGGQRFESVILHIAHQALSYIIYDLSFTIYHLNVQWLSHGLMPEWKPEGLDLSAGPVPVFPIIIYIYRDKRIAAPFASFSLRTSQYR